MEVLEETRRENKLIKEESIRTINELREMLDKEPYILNYESGRVQQILKLEET